MPVQIDLIDIILYVALWIVFVMAVGYGISKRNRLALLGYLMIWALLNTVAMEFISTPGLLYNAIASTAIAIGGFTFGMIFLNKPE